MTRTLLWYISLGCDRHKQGQYTDKRCRNKTQVKSFPRCTFAMCKFESKSMTGTGKIQKLKMQKQNKNWILPTMWQRPFCSVFSSSYNCFFHTLLLFSDSIVDTEPVTRMTAQSKLKCFGLTALISDFCPFLYQSIVCVWDSGRRLVLVSCKLMITFYWQWAPQKAFVGCKKQNNGGAPGGNLSSIFQVFVKNLGIIWSKWEDKKVDTTRLTPWCEPCQKLKIHVSICWFVLSGMRS